MAKFQCGRLFDMNLGLSKKVRELVWRDVLDHCRYHPDFKGKVVTHVTCAGPIRVMIHWEDPEEDN